MMGLMDTEPALISPESEQTAPISLWERLANVLADPVEAFRGIHQQPVRNLHWILPLILTCLCGILFSAVALSNASVVQEMKDQQSKVMAERVAAGKMTAQQAEQAEEVMEKVQPFMIAIAAVSAVAMGVFAFSAEALFLWLVVTKAFKVEMSFSKALEIIGLAEVITILGLIVKLLLVIWMGTMSASASLAILLKNPDTRSIPFVALSRIDLFVWWWVLVVALALAQVTGGGFRKALPWMVGFWLSISLVFIGLASLGR
jgi:Yip1 domain